MSLAEKIREDMIVAMKAKQKDRVSVLRMLTSMVKDVAIETRADVSDEDVMKLLMSYAKKREEAKAGAEKAGRDDLVAKELAEIEVLKDYLPEPLSDTELGALVDEVIGETGAASMKDMGKVMKACQERVAGRADGNRIGQIVRKRLG